MNHPTIYFWKQVPSLRLLVPFIAGILIQWYVPIPLKVLIISFLFIALAGLAFYILPQAYKFSLRWLQGIFVQLLLLVFGAGIVYNHDIVNNQLWIGNHYIDSSALLVTIKEPLVEKAKSYKALGAIEAVQIKGQWRQVKGNMLLYFKKDSLPPTVAYGTQIIFTKPLQKISNSGNPGAFNYQRFCAFQDIHHQAFIKQNEYVITGTTNVNALQQWLFNLRSNVIFTLQNYIYDDREEGVAEALLIGYRDDLDKDLVQAYSNTGVVHIIAISGLHLGMIYMVLVWLFNRFKKRKWIAWTKPIVILGVLWIFSLLAGAVPSILRSAVMFSCIILGEVINKKASIYNNLAVSAFAMLCFNPFYLWDVGFQLSYAAVLSIVTFMKPVYNWFYLNNKILDAIWKMNAVTISAQVLTLPIVLYYFHQFPNLFLITNFVIVPLSSIILFSELALLMVSGAPLLATWMGAMCSAMLRGMNNFIGYMNAIPFSVTENIRMSLPQAIVLAVFIMSLSYWMLRKHKNSLFVGLAAVFVFFVMKGTEIIFTTRQQKLIVYNVPQHTSIDFIYEDKFYFMGDSAVAADGFLKNFHLKSARTIFGIQPAVQLENLRITFPFVEFGQKKILLVDQPYRFQSSQKIPVDLIIIAKNPKLYISELTETFDCKQIVFDGSNALWKINQWKKDCDSLHLPHHSTADKGAFEMNL